MITIAQSGNRLNRQGLQYQPAPLPARPQDPTLQEQAMLMAKNAAADKVTGMAEKGFTDYVVDPFKEKVYTPMKEKVVETWKGFTTPAPATAPASSFTGNMANAATANLGPGGVGGGAAMATPAVSTTTGALANQAAMTQAAGLATPAVAPAVAGTVAPAVAGTGAATAGGMAALGTAVPYIGAGLLAGKALGLFNKGGYVSGPLSMVRYKQSGGPINEEIEVSYSGPLSKEG